MITFGMQGGVWGNQRPLTVAGQSYRKLYTAASGKITSTESDIPLLLRVIDPDLVHAREDGADIRVTLDDGTTPVPHELLRYTRVERHGAAQNWSTHPNAVRYVGTHDKVYLSFLDLDNNEWVACRDMTTGEYTEFKIFEGISTQYVRNDHDDPALCVLEDGRILAVFSEHNGDTFYARRTVNPEDISAWEDVVAVDLTQNDDEQLRRCTYPKPVLFPNGRIYVSFRAAPDLGHQERHQSFGYSDDGGDTWTFFRWLRSPGERPYVMLSGDQPPGTPSTRIDFVTTTGNVNEVARNHLYHGYAEEVSGTLNFYRSDGTSLGDVTAGPLAPDDFTEVFDATTEDETAYNYDIIRVSANDVRISWIKLPENYIRHNCKLHVSFWDGSSWANKFVVDQGAVICDTTASTYMPGAAFDRIDPNIMWVSVQTDGIHRAYRYETDDGGETWSSTLLPIAPLEKTARPMAVHGASEDYRVVWWSGPYTWYGTLLGQESTRSFYQDLKAGNSDYAESAELILWIKPPSTTQGEDLSVFIYYGNPDAADGQDTASVWSNNYLLVWHGRDVPGGPEHNTAALRDSTGNNTPAKVRNANGHVTVEARDDSGLFCQRSINYALRPMNEDLGYNDLGAVDLAGLSAATWEFTTRSLLDGAGGTSAERHHVLSNFSLGGPETARFLARIGSADHATTGDRNRLNFLLRLADDSTLGVLFNDITIDSLEEARVAVVFGGGSLSARINGQLSGVTGSTGQTIQVTPDPAPVLAGYSAHTEPGLIRGEVGSVRISSVARSDAWLALQDASVTDADFWTPGEAEVL